MQQCIIAMKFYRIIQIYKLEIALYYTKIGSKTGIKYIKDIYDYSLKKIFSFEELTGLYNLPRTDFLNIYVSLVQSIPNHWKAQLKQENRDSFRAPTVFDQLQKAKQTNKFLYNILLNSEEVEGKKSEQKWNECFLDEELNWKNKYCTTLTTINEIKIRDFNISILKRIIPTNQFLNKCKLVN